MARTSRTESRVVERDARARRAHLEEATRTARGAVVRVLLGQGADGAAYALASGEESAELWRLRPAAAGSEARRRLTLLAELSHPSLLPIAAVGLDGDPPTVLVRGGPRSRGAPPALVRAHLGELAAALARAHALDIVHGRLGPASVALDADSRPALDLSGLDVYGVAAGPLAPELARGGAPSAASDVWGLATLAAGGDEGALAPLLARMRDPSPERRPSAGGVAAALGVLDEPTSPGAAPEPEIDLGVPRRLGAYELLELLGAGGMGRVYRARDAGTGALVAVKVLHTALARDDELLARFRREARILAALESPHIVRFVGANQQDDLHYLVMEHFAGEPVDRVLAARGRLPLELAASVIADLARGLAEVHALGLVHRDVKPANVLVDLDATPPRVKLCDFGIARGVGPEAEALTAAGTPGTLRYMAPEQITGAPLDARADVYALGLTAYALLAGRPPFEGSPHEVMLAHVGTEPPPLCSLEPSVPGSVADVVMRCLAKEPGARYADAAALHDALLTAWRGTSAPTEAAIPQRIGLAGAPQVYDFRFALRAAPEALWPFVSNTERVNRAAGLDDVEWTHHAGDGGVETRGRFRAAGMELRWKENPFEWIAPSRLGVVREYEVGPFAWLRSTVELAPGETGGTALRHTVEVQPRHLLGRAAAGIEVGLRLRRAFERVYARIDAACVAAPRERTARDDPFEPPSEPAAELRRRLDERLARVLARGADPHAVAALEDELLAAPAPRLARLRPRVFARERGLAEPAVLHALLLAAAEGVLELRWDLICPACRVPSDVAGSLRALAEHGRCEACDLDYALDLARSIELVLAASPSLRRPDAGVYCLGGPAHTPHVLAQLRLPPRGRFVLDLALPPGPYTISGRGLPRRWDFTVAPRASLARWQLALRAGPPPESARSLAPGAQQIELTSDLEREVVVRLERASPREDAFSAAEAATHPLFRELFPAEVLSPDRLVSVAHVAFVLARLPGAIERFERDEAGVHGELVALRELVERAAGEEGGGVSSLRGDGALAAFADPVAALRAAAGVLAGAPGVALALHAGPARATSAGGALAYFGRVVHEAEELARAAAAGELVADDALLAEPRLAPLVAARFARGGYLALGRLLACRLRLGSSAPTM
ncbi:MAG: protein kinase [Sandaracinaceae bacterium]|nr:protein kinase [Sandaracinaceae bacterium]